MSVTNAGGFYLDYGVPADDPGLPDEVFADGDSATISVLVIMRGKDKQATVAPRRFHNVLVSAQNLTSKDSTVVVVARRHEVVQPDPGKTQSLGQIAKQYGLTPGELGTLNASTRNIINVGAR